MFKKHKTLELELVTKNINPKPLCICITEHWYTAPEKSFMKLEEYAVISAWTRRDTKHGGSCIFVKKGVEAEELEYLNNKSIEGHIECSSIVCRAVKSIVLCIYRPPTGNLNSFFENLTEILDMCQNHNSLKKYKIILCGDFNINMETVNPISQSFKTLLLTYNLSQTIFQPTRITKNSVSLLDNIFINFENSCKGEVITTALSDHEGQILRVELTENIEHFKNKGKRRIFSDTKLRQYKYELQNTSWDEILSCVDPNIAYENLTP